jgi:hypothetical protein
MSAAAFHDSHGVSYWTPADRELPDNPRCVLATDGELHFVAVWDDPAAGGSGWCEAYSAEEIDSVITHWMELPEVPE